nr:unnamed protein product [Spirometra erinaceieuropaei]
MDSQVTDEGGEGEAAVRTGVYEVPSSGVVGYGVGVFDVSDLCVMFKCFADATPIDVEALEKEKKQEVDEEKD